MRLTGEVAEAVVVAHLNVRCVPLSRGLLRGLVDRLRFGARSLDLRLAPRRSLVRSLGLRELGVAPGRGLARRLRHRLALAPMRHRTVEIEGARVAGA